MTIAMLPRSPLWRDNPYLDLLEAGLRRHGQHVVDDPNDGLSWRWLMRQRYRVEVLHLHWLQHHYESDSATRSAAALAKFAAKLGLARALRYRLIWTLHNLRPHESTHPRLDHACRRLLAVLAQHVIVHCEEGRRQLESAYGRRRGVHVLPLPNYVEAYPSKPSTDTARRHLGLPSSDLVFLSFGSVRPYKGLHDVVAAFKRLPDSNARLLIAGRPLDQQIAGELTALAEPDGRIRTRLEFIPNEEVPIYFAAADVVVLPFREILTSGSAMLAMSFGRPLIAPTLGCLTELVTPECGLLYEPGDVDALLSALRRCRDLDLEAMGRAAYERVAGSTPEEVAQRHLQVYAA